MRIASSLIILFLTVVSSPAFSDGYFKWIDSRGEIQYGDSPPKNTRLENLVLPELTVIEAYGDQWATPANSSANQRKPRVTQKSFSESVENYERFIFIAPKANQVIRAKDGDVSAMMSISPPLKAGHKLSFKLDGKSREKSRSRIANFTNLTVGYHTLSADILDSRGAVVQSSDTIKFRIIRFIAKKRAKGKR